MVLKEIDSLELCYCLIVFVSLRNRCWCWCWPTHDFEWSLSYEASKLDCAMYHMWESVCGCTIFKTPSFMWRLSSVLGPQTEVSNHRSLRLPLFPCLTFSLPLFLSLFFHLSHWKACTHPATMANNCRRLCRSGELHNVSCWSCSR